MSDGDDDDGELIPHPLAGQPPLLLSVTPSAPATGDHQHYFVHAGTVLRHVEIEIERCASPGCGEERDRT